MRSVKKSIVVGMFLLLASTSIPAVGKTLCGHYEITGAKVGMRAWANGTCSHGHKKAGVKLTEGSYDSGWKYGTDVTVSKVNNPLYTAVARYKFVS